MPRLLKLLGLALLAVWLPATMHCRLEAAGVHFTTEECCDHEQPGCDGDLCAGVEENLIKDTSATSGLPELDACECHFCTVVATSVSREPGRRLLPPLPPVGAGDWQFVERAAPSAQAP